MAGSAAGSTADPAFQVLLVSLAETTFPSAETTFPPAETTFPLADAKFPLAETTFPFAETTLPLAETMFPLAETMFPPLRFGTCLLGARIICCRVALNLLLKIVNLKF